MQFDLPRAGGLLLLVILLSAAGLAVAGTMTTRTILLMVAPSMIAFGAIAFALGVKHGEYRATYST